MAMSLAAARVNAGFTQSAAAEALHINRNTLSSYEKYKTIPDIDKAKEIAALYGRTVDEIRWS